MRAIASTITAALETALEMAFAAVGLLIVISSGPFVLRAASQGTTTVSLALDTFANTSSFNRHYTSCSRVTEGIVSGRPFGALLVV